MFPVEIFSTLYQDYRFMQYGLLTHHRKDTLKGIAFLVLFKK